MNFVEAMKIAYNTCRENRMHNVDTPLFIYIRRKSGDFDIRIRPYKCQPESRRRYEYKYLSEYYWGTWEWGLCIYNEDYIADDWIVSKEELV